MTDGRMHSNMADVRGILAVALLSTTLIAGTAVSAAVQSTPEPLHPAPELTRADLESWLDGYLPGALQRSDMAGAVVVVVKDGEILFQKGYGYADMALHTPVDPATTVFRIASISKTFAATAVMQLVEQGKLDLDRDVNAYLDFKIPDAWGKPITLRNLMTHTAGFDDLQKGSSPIDPRWYVPLDEFLKRRSPNRITAPGTIPAYSNYGVALASYILQRVSGEVYEDYLERHIFEPLGMRHTTCRQPLPEVLRPSLAKAYRLASGPAQPFELLNVRAAGCISSTGTDMAHFMIAHLQEGRFGEQRILKPQTARLMHSTVFKPSPHINGLAMIFFEDNYNGEHIIGHDGDTKGFHSNMQLFLNRDIGIFVDFNADGRNTAVYALREALAHDLIDRYFPSPIPDEPSVATAPEHARLAAGNYQAARRLNGVLGVYMMFNGINVRANADGTISIPMPPTGDMRTYHEIAPFLWREVGGKDLLEMKVQDGQVTTLFNHPLDGLVRVPAWASAGFALPPLAASAAVLLLTALFWPAAALVRRHYGRAAVFQGSDAMAYRLARFGAVMGVIFLGGWLIVSVCLINYFYMFTAGIDPWLRILHIVGLLAVFGTGAAIWSAWRLWRACRPWPSRLWSVALVAAFLYFTWFTFEFNLITASLNY